jgi:hypothetical protein
VSDGRTHTGPSTDLVAGLHERTSLVSALRNPDITLARAAATYLLFKRRRLTDASERGYAAVLNDFEVLAWAT